MTKKEARRLIPAVEELLEILNRVAEPRRKPSEGPTLTAEGFAKLMAHDPERLEWVNRKSYNWGLDE